MPLSRMTPPLLVVAAAVGFAALAAADGEPYPTLGTIDRKDLRFDKLIPPGAKLEKLAEGFDWAEGPVWVPAGRYLLFNDIPKNTTFKWKDGKGVDVYLKPSGYSGTAPFTGREP